MFIESFPVLGSLGLCRRRGKWAWLPGEPEGVANEVEVSREGQRSVSVQTGNVTLSDAALRRINLIRQSDDLKNCKSNPVKRFRYVPIPIPLAWERVCPIESF